MELKTIEKASEQLREKNEASGLQSIAKGLGEQQRTAYYTLPSNGKEHIVQVAIKEFADFFLMNRKKLQTICFNPTAESRWAIIRTAFGKSNNPVGLNLSNQTRSFT